MKRRLSRQSSVSAEMLNTSKSFPMNNGQVSLPSTSATTTRKFNSKRTPLYLDVCYDRERERKRSADNIDIMPTLKERLPPIYLIEPETAELKDRLHDELKSKYPAQTSDDIDKPTKAIVKPPRKEPVRSDNPAALPKAHTSNEGRRPKPAPRNVQIGSNEQDSSTTHNQQPIATSRRNGRSKNYHRHQSDIEVSTDTSPCYRISPEPP